MTMSTTFGAIPHPFDNTGVCSLYSQYFTKLSAPTRIDVMVQLMELLHPFEVRLLGSILEELGRKDSTSMRGYESQVNDPEFWRHIESVQDDRSRSILITALPFVKSSNREVKSHIYRLIGGVELMLRQLGTTIAPRVLEEVRLLLTVARHHAAFFYDERQHFVSLLAHCITLLDARRMAGDAPPPPHAATSTAMHEDDGGEMSFAQPTSMVQLQTAVDKEGSLDGQSSVDGETCSPPNTVLLDDAQLMLLPPQTAQPPTSVSPTIVNDYQQQATCSQPPFGHDDEEEEKRTRSDADTSTTATAPMMSEFGGRRRLRRLRPCDPLMLTTMLKFEVAPTDGECFDCKVQWSDAVTTEVTLSVADVVEFHNELVDFHPEQSGCYGRDRQIPYIPNEARCTSRDAYLNELIGYLKYVAVFPPHVQGNRVCRRWFDRPDLLTATTDDEMEEYDDTDRSETGTTTASSLQLVTPVTSSTVLNAPSAPALTVTEQATQHELWMQNGESEIDGTTTTIDETINDMSPPKQLALESELPSSVVMVTETETSAVFEEETPPLSVSSLGRSRGRRRDDDDGNRRNQEATADGYVRSYPPPLLDNPPPFPLPTTSTGSYRQPWSGGTEFRRGSRSYRNSTRGGSFSSAEGGYGGRSNRGNWAYISDRELFNCLRISRPRLLNTPEFRAVIADMSLEKARSMTYTEMVRLGMSENDAGEFLRILHPDSSPQISSVDADTHRPKKHVDDSSATNSTIASDCAANAAGETDNDGEDDGQLPPPPDEETMTPTTTAQIQTTVEFSSSVTSLAASVASVSLVHLPAMMENGATEHWPRVGEDACQPDCDCVDTVTPLLVVPATTAEEKRTIGSTRTPLLPLEMVDPAVQVVIRSGERRQMKEIGKSVSNRAPSHHYPDNIPPPHYSTATPGTHTTASVNNGVMLNALLPMMRPRNPSAYALPPYPSQHPSPSEVNEPSTVTSTTIPTVNGHYAMPPPPQQPPLVVRPPPLPLHNRFQTSLLYSNPSFIGAVPAVQQNGMFPPTVIPSMAALPTMAPQMWQNRNSFQATMPPSLPPNPVSCLNCGKSDHSFANCQSASLQDTISQGNYCINF